MGPIAAAVSVFIVVQVQNSLQKNDLFTPVVGIVAAPVVIQKGP